jgi:hypothetical protein
MGHRLLIVVPLALMLSGCVTSVVKTVVTAPFKVGGAVIDAATTSQAEADRNRGRDERKAEERAEKDRKKAGKRARHKDDD